MKLIKGNLRRVVVQKGGSRATNDKRGLRPKVSMVLSEPGLSLGLGKRAITA